MPEKEFIPFKDEPIKSPNDDLFKNPIDGAVYLIRKTLLTFSDFIERCFRHVFLAHPEWHSVTPLPTAVFEHEFELRRRSLSRLRELKQLWQQEAPRVSTVAKEAAAVSQPFRFCGRYNASAMEMGMRLANICTLVEPDNAADGGNADSDFFDWVLGIAIEVAMPEAAKKIDCDWRIWRDLGGKFKSEISRLLAQIDCEAARLRPGAVATEDWQTVSGAAHVINIDKGLISRLCDEGRVRTNGKKGRDRRIDMNSLADYKRQLDAKRL